MPISVFSAIKPSLQKQNSWHNHHSEPYERCQVDHLHVCLVEYLKLFEPMKMTYWISYAGINMKMKRGISHNPLTDTNPLNIPLWNNVCNLYLMVCFLMNTDTSRYIFTATWEADISWKTVLHNSFSVGNIWNTGPTLPLELSTHRIMTTIQCNCSLTGIQTL